MNLGTNITAIISSRYLNKSEKQLQTSLQRLSSGLKINTSKDDSAGMAISEKMKTQIKGLERSSMNASDGISVVQAAESALNEIESMLQRMNELAVEGANETFTDEDRKNMNCEMQALSKEIDRISQDTAFNNTKLLNGDIQRRTYSTIDNGGQKNLTNGVDTTYFSNSVEAGTYGITLAADGTADFAKDADGNRIGFSDSAMMTVDGNKIKVTDNNAFAMEFTINEPVTGDVMVELWDIGTMPIQIGANAGQIVNIGIPEVSTRSLNIDGMDYTTADKCNDAITVIGQAISRVSNVRSEIGAMQNRFEYCVSSLDSTQESMTAALSRITDVDMAEEMTNYTQSNVLQQAGVSMVAQANQLPEKVLQLLQ